MCLIGLHPAVAFRSCDDCRRFVYDEETGRRALCHGEPVPRPPGTLPPCGYGKDVCPKGSPHAGRELSPSNVAAYTHYLQCRATGQFPDDPIVRRNAAVIRAAESVVRDSAL